MNAGVQAHDFLLQVYNADGEFLFKFGSHGEGNGQFNAPTGVAVDANGNIIVADWGNSRIQVPSVYYCIKNVGLSHILRVFGLFGPVGGCSQEWRVLREAKVCLTVAVWLVQPL